MNKICITSAGSAYGGALYGECYEVVRKEFRRLLPDIIVYRRVILDMRNLHGWGHHA
jgi:hypothetical protein